MFPCFSIPKTIVLDAKVESKNFFPCHFRTCVFELSPYVSIFAVINQFNQNKYSIFNLDVARENSFCLYLNSLLGFQFGCSQGELILSISKQFIRLSVVTFFSDS